MCPSLTKAFTMLPSFKTAKNRENKYPAMILNCILSKKVWLFWFWVKLKRKIVKPILYRKHIQHLGIEHWPWNKFISLTITPRELSRQNFGAQISRKRNYIFCIHLNVSSKKIFKNKTFEKMIFFVSFKWRLEVTANIHICKKHCGYKLSIIAENLKSLSMIHLRKKLYQQKHKSDISRDKKVSAKKWIYNFVYKFSLE